MWNNDFIASNIKCPYMFSYNADYAVDGDYRLSLSISRGITTRVKPPVLSK